MICIAENSGGKGGVAGGAGAHGQASQQAGGAGMSDYGYPVLEVVTGMTTDLTVQLTQDYAGEIPADLSSITKVEFRARPSMVSYDKEIVVDCSYTDDGKVTVHLTPEELNFNNGVWYSEFLTYKKEADTVPPATPIIYASTTQPTNQPVLITIKFSDDSLTREYERDNSGVWSPYLEPVVFVENGSIRARAIDAAGNESRIASYVIANIDTIPPVAPKFTITPDTPTNGDVAVVASFSDDSTVHEFSKDGVTWNEYINPIVFHENGFVWFRGTDSVGNKSGITVATVNNIVKEQPTPPVLAASVLTETDESVFVTAIFEENVVRKEYSLDECVTWQPYTDPIECTSNGLVYVRGFDAAGNVSNATECRIANIDKTPPLPPTVTADITEPTTGPVAVSASFSGDSTIIEYSLNANTWQAYTGPVVFEMNGYVLFRGMDAAGNVSAITSYTVNNITPATSGKPMAVANITAPVGGAGSVIVSAVFSDDSVLCEYSMDAENWEPYTHGIEFHDNGVVYFRSTDAEGVVSEITEYEVDNIYKVAPMQPLVTADITEATKTDVVLTATLSADTAQAFFKFEDTDWQPYFAPITVGENATLYFKAEDVAGNVSAVTQFEVTNINKTFPLAPVVTADVDTYTTGSVVVTAAYSEDTVVKQFKENDSEWSVYEGPISVTSNTTLFFRGINETGNSSPVVSYIVGNIQPDVPQESEPTSGASTAAQDMPQPTVPVEATSEDPTKPIEAESVLVANYRSYLCIRKGMTGSTNGPDSVTAMDVRLAIMDTSIEANQLLDDLEFSDMMIYHAVERAINEWNEVPPMLEHKFNATNFPWKEFLIKGAVVYLMQEVAFRYNRNRMQYSASGLQLDTNDKGPAYIAMAQAARKEWKDFVNGSKTYLNMQECFGTFQLPYFGNRCYW